jgi:hypothetical protein
MPGDIFQQISSGSAPQSQASTPQIGDVFDKLSSGGTTTKEALQNYAPPVPRPQVKMQESGLAPSQAAMQPDQRLSDLAAQGGEGGISDEGQSAAMSTAGAGTLAALIGARGAQAMAQTALGREILGWAAKGAAHAVGGASVYGIGKKLGWWAGK